MGNILITASHFQTLCQDAIRLLEDNGHHVILNDHDMPYYSFEELAVWAPDIQGAIIGMDQWNEQVFQIAPKLKILARFGVGVDNVDLEAAKRHGVQVVNAAGLNANAVAELGVALILNCLRSIPQLNQKLDQGEWARPWEKRSWAKRWASWALATSAAGWPKSCLAWGWNCWPMTPIPTRRRPGTCT